MDSCEGLLLATDVSTTSMEAHHIIIFSQGIVDIVEDTQCMKNNLTLENLSSAKEVVRSEKVFVNAEIDERDFLFDHHTISIL